MFCCNQIPNSDFPRLTNASPAPLFTSTIPEIRYWKMILPEMASKLSFACSQASPSRDNAKCKVYRFDKSAASSQSGAKGLLCQRVFENVISPQIWASFLNFFNLFFEQLTFICCQGGLVLFAEKDFLWPW